MHEIAAEFDNISFAGKVSNELLRKYMSTADLVVQLSEGEGFGFTTLEAMGCGTNVLVNDLPVFRETLEDKAFFTSLDENEVRNSIYHAIENKKPAAELIEHSKKYSISQTAENTLHVYSQIIGS